MILGDEFWMMMTLLLSAGVSPVVSIFVGKIWLLEKAKSKVLGLRRNLYLVSFVGFLQNL